MYAVIESGGKQYKVQEGDVLFLDKMLAEEGSIVTFNNVLVVSKEDIISFGRPFLEDVAVEAKVIGHGKHKKIIVFKYKAKKNYRRKQGHRQPYTKVQVERIITKPDSTQEEQSIQ
jgi:large subunit ribosomal protein L21